MLRRLPAEGRQGIGGSLWLKEPSKARKAEVIDHDAEDQDHHSSRNSAEFYATAPVCRGLSHLLLGVQAHQEFSWNQVERSPSPDRQSYEHCRICHPDCGPCVTQKEGVQKDGADKWWSSNEQERGVEAQGSLATRAHAPAH